MSIAQIFAIVFAMNSNADAQIIFECMEECGKQRGVRVYYDHDFQVEGITCECADVPYDSF